MPYGRGPLCVQGRCKLFLRWLILVLLLATPTWAQQPDTLDQATAAQFQALATQPTHWPAKQLSQAEIDDMHSCVIENQLVLCAGEQRLLTGISVAPDLVGWRVTPTGATPKYRWAGPEGSVEYLLSVSMMQAVGPQFKRNFYVIDDDGLRKIIELARRDPTWKP